MLGSLQHGLRPIGCGLFIDAAAILVANGRQNEQPKMAAR